MYASVRVPIQSGTGREERFEGKVWACKVRKWIHTVIISRATGRLTRAPWTSTCQDIGVGNTYSAKSHGVHGVQL